VPDIKRHHLIKSIVNGYLNIILKVGYLIFTLFTITIVCALMISPFWYLAVKNRVAFNYVFLVTLIVGIASLMTIKIKNSKKNLFTLVISSIKRVLKYTLAILTLYIILLLYVSGRYISGITLTIVSLLLFGYFKYAYPVNKKDKGE